MRPQTKRKKKAVRLTGCRKKGALTKFYEFALPQGAYGQALTYNFVRLV